MSKDPEGYIKFLEDMFTDKPTMEFEAYIQLSMAMEENPAFRQTLAVAYYMDIIHNLMERNPDMFQEITEMVKTDVWAMVRNCPKCGKALLSVVKDEE